jgi:heterodisulfide reductase subunit B
MEKLKFSYYPGCSLESTAQEYDHSVRAVSEMLGIELMELSDWSCCGASSGHSTNYQLSIALPARNLALAEKEGWGMAVVCAACFLRFKQTNHDLHDNDVLRQEIATIIGMPYQGGVEVRHFLDIVCRDVGLDEIEYRVKRPLNKLKLVSYYGCYLVRPPEITQFDDSEYPMLMDDLISAIGAEALDWSHKVECCGGNLLLSRPDIVVKLVGDIIQAASDAGADGIVTACPLCQANLDTRQHGPTKLPIFYFSELLGLALGVDEKSLTKWWKRHINSPDIILKVPVSDSSAKLTR